MRREATYLRRYPALLDDFSQVFEHSAISFQPSGGSLRFLLIYSPYAGLASLLTADR
jgi:hypothetical protein